MSRKALALSALGLSLLGLVACASDDDCPDGANCLEECAQLDADACDASESCGPIQGKPLVENGEGYCLDYQVAFEDLGCMPAQSGCTEAEVFALDPEGVGYYFSNGCIPDDFEAMADNVGECAQGA